MVKKRWIIGIGIVLLLLVVVSATEPSLFEFLSFVKQSPLPDTMTVYAYGPNGLISKQKGSEVSYYHNDNLRSSALVTDEDGKVVYSTDYYPFGSSLHEEGEERYTYNSKELDSTGLYYYGARYYDSSIGRFISIDPVSGNIFNGQRLNPYSYTLNNPLKYVDVNGELPVLYPFVIWGYSTLSDPTLVMDIGDFIEAAGNKDYLIMTIMAAGIVSPFSGQAMKKPTRFVSSIIFDLFKKGQSVPVEQVLRHSDLLENYPAEALQGVTHVRLFGKSMRDAVETMERLEKVTTQSDFLSEARHIAKQQGGKIVETAPHYRVVNKFGQVVTEIPRHKGDLKEGTAQDIRIELQRFALDANHLNIKRTSTQTILSISLP